ncbi:MAG: hypothetical protein EKE20_14585 [Candidatus Symbiopectobacterium sp. Dall1.0]|nr:hypothetical protein [Candidatus Symbiopectobacterium sp. Dall1.0]
MNKQAKKYLDKITTISQIIKDREKSSYDSDICIRLYGLDYDFWLSAEEIVSIYGDLRSYLEEIIGINETSEVLNRDWEVVDVEGDTLAVHFLSYSIFDWNGYANALEILTKTGMDYEEFNAGLYLDIPPENIQEAYYGRFRSDTDFAEEVLENCGEELSDFVISYFDYEKFARDLLIGDYQEHNGYYFSMNY